MTKRIAEGVEIVCLAIVCTVLLWYMLLEPFFAAIIAGIRWLIRRKRR